MSEESQHCTFVQYGRAYQLPQNANSAGRFPEEDRCSLHPCQCRVRTVHGRAARRMMCPLHLSAIECSCDGLGPGKGLVAATLDLCVGQGQRTGGHSLSSGRSSFKPKSVSSSVFVSCMVAAGSLKSSCPFAWRLRRGQLVSQSARGVEKQRHAKRTRQQNARPALQAV